MVLSWCCTNIGKVYKLTKSRVVGIVIVQKNPCARAVSKPIPKVPTIPTSAAAVGGGVKYIH